MHTKLQKFLADPIAMCAVKVYELNDGINRCCSSFFTAIIALIKGVRIGGTLHCWGIPYLQRVPGSVITLGRDCLLRSSFKSNNIGYGTRSRLTTNAPGARIEIGDRVGMSSVTISAKELIRIGSDTLVGGNVLITDSDWHSLDPAHRQECDAEATRPVLIGKNVFIGTRAIILKGSSIGDNSIIGAGSVVCGKIPANVIAAGNPCRVIKDLK